MNDREMTLYWREKMLYWLADCESATLEYLSGLKNPPKHELHRHKSICDDLYTMLAQNTFTKRESSPERVMDRLAGASTSASYKLETSK
jgi:hypothetical protein